MGGISETPKLPESPSLAVQAGELLKLLGGTKTDSTVTSTSNAGDISGLQSTLAGLQGTDYEAMLRAIFNKAGGQIPGIQQALGNAMGARSGNNSAVQAALQRLLEQTSTNSADQVAKLQAQNFQTQANVGNSIAAATKDTQKTEASKTKVGTDVGSGLTEAAKLIALLQGAKTLGMDKWVKDLTTATPEAINAPATTAPVASVQSASLTSPLGQTAPVNYNLAGTAPASPLSYAPNQYTPNIDYSLPATNYSNQGLDVQPSFQPDYQLGSFDYSLAPSMPDGGLDYAPNYTVEDYVPPEEWQPDYSFADGGLVSGRNGHTAPMEPNDAPASEQAAEENEARSNARYDVGFTANKFLDTFRELLGSNDSGKAEGYADGGTIRAGGSRRSANPTVAFSQLTRPVASQVQQAPSARPQAPAAMPVAAAQQPAPQIMPPVASINFGQGTFDGGNSSRNTNINTVDNSGFSARDYGQAVGKIGAVNNISGLTGGPTLGKSMGLLGLSANLANAKDAKDAALAAGKFAVSSAIPAAAPVMAFATNPTVTNAADIALSMVNPAYALASAATNLFGLASPAEIASNVFSTPNQMMTPAQQEIQSIESNNPSSFGLTQQANAMPGDALDNLMSITDAFSTSGSTDSMSGYGGPGTGYGGNPDSAATDAGDRGEANGGPIDGPGTGTSDSIPARLSDGEFVISADVVNKLGEDFFNQLQAAFHIPVAQQRRA